LATHAFKNACNGKYWRGFYRTNDVENALHILKKHYRYIRLALKQREYEIHFQLSLIFEKTGEIAKAFTILKLYAAPRRNSQPVCSGKCTTVTAAF